MYRWNRSTITFPGACPITSTITHFEIYGPRPEALIEFYRSIFGWSIEQMPGIDYWRVHAAQSEGGVLSGGLTYRAIPNLNGWMLYVSVESVDATIAEVVRLGGSVVRPKTAVPKTAWVCIIADPAKNIFGIWQADAKALPMPDPNH